MEVRATFRHPDQDKVKGLVGEILSEGRRLAKWHIEMMEFDFFSGMYRVRLGLDGNEAIAKIPTEVIDAVWRDGDRFKRKKIRHLLKKAVKTFYELED